MSCKAPLNFIASADPHQRIHAEGFIPRTAAEKPRSWWTVMGIWVYALSICGPFLAVPTVYWLAFGSWQAIPLPSRTLALVTLPWAVVVGRCTVHFLTWRWESRRG